MYDNDLYDPRFAQMTRLIQDEKHRAVRRLARQWAPGDRDRQKWIYRETRAEAEIRPMTGDRLIFTPGGATRLAEVHAFIADQPANAAGRAVRRSFAKSYAYLNEYGGADADGRRFQLTLGEDYAPLSFCVAFETRQPGGGFADPMIGGLIYHAASQAWGVHT